MKIFKKILIAVTTMIPFFGSALAQESFYKNKTIEYIVGFPPGGGYDTYGRLFSRYLPDHIEGNPKIVVRNMPGVASQLLADHIANRAPKDGLTIGGIGTFSITDAILEGKTLPFSAKDFNFLGSYHTDYNICVANNKVSINSFNDLLTKEIILGATSAESIQWPKLSNILNGTKFKIVPGYKGSNELYLAVIKGEVDGACALSFDVTLSLFNNELSNGELKFFLQMDDETGAPKLANKNVLNLIDFSKNQEDREIYSKVFGIKQFGKPIVFAKEVPADRVEILRKAFVDTLNDPRLVADAEKMRLSIDYKTGIELQNSVNALYNTNPTLLTKINSLMKETK